MKHKKEIFIVIVLLLILTTQNILSSDYLSPTADEHKHITRGYVYLTTGDSRFSTIQPVLINSINAIPLLFMNLNLPIGSDDWNNNKLIDFSLNFFFYSGNDLESIFKLARIPTFILSIILGVFVYLWAKKLYGVRSGIFALFLCVFSINILAYSALTTNDIGATLLIFLSIYTLWRYHSNQTLFNLLLSGFVFGLALISKSYALIFIPTIIILLFIVLKKEKLFYIFKIITIFFLISWTTLNIGYGFDGTFKSIEQNVIEDTGSNKEIYTQLTQRVPVFITKVPIMLPYNYLKGIVSTGGVTLERSNREFYFFEKVYQEVPKYFYILMFFLKTQIPLIIFLILTIFFYRKLNTDDYFFLIPIGIFVLLFSIHPIANGFRHFLPIFPFLFVFVSKLININSIKYTLIVLCLWYAIAPIVVSPHYIPYYNEFIGMDNGYKVSINGDVDWGQDLKQLKKYMDNNGIEHIGLSYFGQTLPGYYNISYTYLPSSGDYINKQIENCTPYKGVVAISIAHLKQPFLFKNESCYDWLNGLQPIYRVGYTIYIFNSTSTE